VSLGPEDQRDARDRDFHRTDNLYVDSSVSEKKKYSAGSIEGSNLDWKDKENDDLGRLLRSYPLKLFDRAAQSVVEESKIDESFEQDDICAEVQAENGNCRILVENEFGLTGIEVYDFDEELYFEEYVANSREDLVSEDDTDEHFHEDDSDKWFHEDDLDRCAFAYALSDEDLDDFEDFDEFFEGITVEENCLAYKA